MKLRYLFLLYITPLILACGGKDLEEFTPPDPVKPEEPDKELLYHERARELFDLINLYYRVNNGATAGLYNENYPKKAGDNPASYLWPYDGLVSGVTLLHKLGYNVDYSSFVNRFDLYYRTSANGNNIGGFGSSTDGTKGGGTRFYDDNSIVGINLVEAYRLTGNESYRSRAKDIVAFLQSGEDQLLGGGLWWNEDEKNIPGNENSNKPTCSNGYATHFLLQYYTICTDGEKAAVLAFAKRLYSWINTNLRDPDDGCYWNDIKPSGSINNTKWTYNTGVMISNGVQLFKLTGEQVYLDKATESARGSYSYFARPRGKLALAYPDHDPWFTTKLIRSYIDILPYHANAGSYINTFVNYLDYAWKNARFSNGLFYEDWTGTTPKRAEQLLMQAAALESLSLIAIYKGESVKK